jgi:hypothetical protein
MNFDLMKSIVNDLEKDKVKKNRDSCCDNPNIVSYCEIDVCSECGTIAKYYEQSITEYVHTIRDKKNNYTKMNYFSSFLNLIQCKRAISIQNLDKLVALFVDIKNYYSVLYIKLVLLRNHIKHSNFSYVPEIYYRLNNTQPIILCEETRQKIVNKYIFVLRYMKQKKIKIASSKRYFLFRFIQDCTKKDEKPILKFVDNIKCESIRERYDKLYDDIFIQE